MRACEVLDDWLAACLRTCARTVYVCLCFYISREIRGSGASSRPDDGRTSSGPDVEAPLSCARRRHSSGESGGEIAARASVLSPRTGIPTTIAHVPHPIDYQYQNRPRQGWDQVQCVLMNLNQFDKYSWPKKSIPIPVKRSTSAAIRARLSPMLN